MPCRDDGPHEPTREELRDRKATPLLCYVMGQLTPSDIGDRLLRENPSLAAWWRSHQKEDASRIAHENADDEMRRVKKSALAKLTKKERNVLGFNGEDE